MKHSNFKRFLCLVLVFAMVLPFSVYGVTAAETPVVVDDTVTDSTLDHYFTYTSATDPNGMTGWASDTKGSIQTVGTVNDAGNDVAQTQHWVWNQDYAEASKHTYTFTFTGTGAEIVGVKNDAQNTFAVDGGTPETVNITGAANTPVVLYSVEGLEYGEHTIAATLPSGGTGLQVCYANVYTGSDSGEDDGEVTEVKTRIPHTQTTGEANYFTFSETGWSEGGNQNHIWSDILGDNPENCWYTVDFIGHAIDIYAGKNWPMGYVNYYIDDTFVGKFDLYQSYNSDSLFITKIEGLEEGPHTFKAVATGENGAGGKNRIDCAEVYVYHAPYAAESITLAETAITLTEGATRQISYTVTPSYVELSDVVYASSNEAVATVSKSGLITAVGAGSATVTLTSAVSNITKTIAVTVNEAIPGIAGSIVDYDTHWTQDRYTEARGLGTLSQSLTAWKNDVAISELALLSVDSALKNVTITASDFTSGSNVIDSDNVTATFIRSTKAYNGGYIWGSYPADNGTNRSESPDILWTTEPTDIAYNAVQGVWVEFAVPADAAAGTYTGTLTVTADGLEDGLTFSYTLTVQDVVLPDATTYGDTFDVELWQYPYSVAEYYGVDPFSPEHFEALRSVMDIYKSIGGHAITTTIQEEAWSGQTYSANTIHYPSMIRWEKVNGVMTYDYSDFDAWVEFCKEMGIGDKIVLYSIAPWHNTIKYWENGVLKSEANNFGNITSDTMWEHFLNNLIAHLEEKGWFDDAYIGIDERGFSAAAFDLIDSVKNSEGKSLKTAGAMDAFVDKWSLALRVTDLNVGDTAAKGNAAKFAELLTARDALGYRTTLYSCTGHQPGNFSLCAPVESYWVIMNAGRMGGAGFLRWAYDAWVENPLYDTTHQNFEAGDCFLVFPDEKDAENPVARRSVRLARIAEAVRDVNKLMYIEKNVPALASEVDAVYANLGGHLGPYGTYSCPSAAVLGNEAAAIKTDIAELTERYITLSDGGTNVVESVTIAEGEEATVILGGTLELTAVVTPDNLIDNTVVWTTSDELVATVANGVVTGRTLGTAVITATSVADPSKSDSITITVDTLKVDAAKQVAYYSFDNVTGTTVEDEWGDYDATMKEGATTAPGKSGNALSVNTAGMGAVVENNQELDTDWSVSYWVNTTAAFTDEISVLEDYDQAYSTSLKLANGRASGFRVGNNSGDVLTMAYDFQPNTWYHLTWVQDKDVGLSLYVNGSLVTTNTWPVTHAVKSPIDVIGGTGFTGLIDEVKVFNAPLTTEEIATLMLVDGINLGVESVEVNVGDTYQIEASVVSKLEDKSLTYESADPSIATVTDKGLVTGVARGTTTITVTNEAGGFTATLTVKVNKQVNIHNVLDRYVMPDIFMTTIERAPGTDRQYLGQPDMIETETGRLITAYPIGHGKGPLVMRISDDAGRTWTEKTDLPASWAGSQETPTLYTVTVNGNERLLLITACPGWGTDSAGNQYGFNVSYSDDNGESWSEYEHFWSYFSDGDANDAIVAMASLVQLKDENGNYIEKWMGVFHNYSFVNYKTYLTFDEEGNMQWSEPVPYLSEHRAIEDSHDMCEIGMFRSPDGKRIIGLARSQSHQHLSTMIYSDDEGQTWSEPVELPGSLAGERHKAQYDPVTGKLVITFREINYDKNGDGVMAAGDWICGDWGLWVGTYEQLMNLEDGDYCVTIDEDFTQNTYSGDTGYAGFVVLEDGTFVMNSYGHWEEDFSKSWGFGNVTTDLCYIRQARFTLADLEHMVGIEDDHNYTETRVEATCTTDGSATYTCICGHSYAEVIPAPGHNYVDEICTVCGHVNSVCAVVVETGEQYRTIAEAVAAAAEGQTVKLLRDTAEARVLVTPGVTLDLAGYVLTADYLVGFDTARVVDTVGGGRLIAQQDNVVLDVANGMVPVYDGKGYVFTKAGFAISKDTKHAGEGIKINAIACPVNMGVVDMLKDGAADNNLQIMIVLTWDTEEGTGSQEFVFTDEVVASVYSSNGGRWNSYSKMFSMVITGVESIQNLKANIVIVSGTDAEYGSVTPVAVN